jgi:hypothetical protein
LLDAGLPKRVGCGQSSRPVIAGTIPQRRFDALSIITILASVQLYELSIRSLLIHWLGVAKHYSDFLRFC